MFSRTRFVKLRGYFNAQRRVDRKMEDDVVLFNASTSGSSARKQDIFNHLKANDPSFLDTFSVINRGRTC